MARIGIAGIVDEGRAGSRRDRAQFRPPPAEQRPDHREAGDHRAPAHPGKPRDARAARGAHHEGLRLIVGMVRGGERIGAMLARPIRQQRIARLPRPRLDARAGDRL